MYSTGWSAIAPPAATFGTAEQLRANRAFLARHNYASTLRAFAKQEYEQRKEDIRQWLDQAYATRVDFLKTLVPAAFAGSLEVCDWPAGQGPEEFEFVGGHGVKFRSDYMASTKEGEDGCSHSLGWMDEIHPDYTNTAFMPYLRTGGEALRGWKPLCQETGQKASYFFVVRPTNTAELAWLLGKPVSELPDVLQELSALYPAAGNSILDRIDLMLWALKNPWAKFQLGARMGLSKRGLAQLQKQHAAVIDLSHLDGENLRAFRNVPVAPPSSRPSHTP